MLPPTASLISKSQGKGPWWLWLSSSSGWPRRLGQSCLFVRNCDRVSISLHSGLYTILRVEGFIALPWALVNASPSLCVLHMWSRSQLWICNNSGCFQHRQMSIAWKGHRRPLVEEMSRLMTSSAARPWCNSQCPGHPAGCWQMQTHCKLCHVRRETKRNKTRVSSKKASALYT